MPLDLDACWKQLEADYVGEGVYTRLDLNHEKGIRMAILSPGKNRAIMIEINPGEEQILSPPRWKGLGYQMMTFGSTLTSEVNHLVLSEEGTEYRLVFTALCSDIIRTVELSDRGSRAQRLKLCFDRWSRFFEKYVDDGLSAEEQRGLFGELLTLELLIEHGFPVIEAVTSWKGSQGCHQDFFHRGVAIEVKTTITKEPRMVAVSNEIQLDDRGLEALFLLVLTIQQHDGGPRTLPDLVKNVLERLEADSGALFIFESNLIGAGYLHSDSDRYNKRYGIKKTEVFKVGEGFPRIIDIDPGVGDLYYRVVISTCQSFSIELDQALRVFMGV